jgi:DNA-binding PadR family transcriptional regulator
MQLDEFIINSRERAVKAFLDLVMLHLLSKHAMSGYEISKALIKKFGLIIGPSTIYSKLFTLEKQGLLNCTESRSGKVYSLTEEGKQLAANTESVLNDVHSYLTSKLPKTKKD